MKHIARSSLVLITCMLCSCAGVLAFLASPPGQVVMQLGALGLKAAVENGKIKQGDSIAIQKGVAIVTSPDSTKTKSFKLADLGLQEAVDRKIVKHGDAILIQEATAIIKSVVMPTTAAKAPAPSVQ